MKVLCPLLKQKHTLSISLPKKVLFALVALKLLFVFQNVYVCFGKLVRKFCLQKNMMRKCSQHLAKAYNLR